MKPIVLVIDDDALDRRAVRRALNDSFELMEADCCAAAHASIRQTRPSCIVLDYTLPGTDAIELLGDLVAQKLPVVMLSGLRDEEIVDRAMNAGAHAYLLKGDDDAPTVKLLVEQAIAAAET